MVEEAQGKRKGTDWKPVKVSSLSKEMQKAHKEYQATLEKTKELEKNLKDDLRNEWDESFPNGREKDGKVCAFNITGGRLQYAWKDRPKMQSKGVDDGDDVFAHP